MSTATTISVALIFSFIAVASQLYGMWNNHKKNQDQEEQKAVEIEKNFIKLDLKLDQYQKSTDAILARQEQHAVRMENLSGEIIKSNERIETLFKYKDDHEVRLKHLEHLEGK